MNHDALEQMKQAGVRWVRVGSCRGEGRGVYAVLELPNWLYYRDGTADLSELILARTVNEMHDVGRDAWVSDHKGRHPIDRYQFSGTVYYLRDDDLETERAVYCDLPASAVPIEDVLSLPNRVMVSGLAPAPTTTAHARFCAGSGRSVADESGEAAYV